MSVETSSGDVADTSGSSCKISGKQLGNVEFKPAKYTIHRQVERSVDSQFSKERQHPVYIAKLPSSCVSMNVGIIEAGGIGGNHRHYYESMIYVIKGRGYSIVEGVKVEWEAGDVIYVPPWAWHQHYNFDENQEIRYIASTNAPLLQNVGNIARREEAG